MTIVFTYLYAYALAERASELMISRRNRRAMERQGFSQRESSSSLAGMVALHISWLIASPIEAIWFSTPLPLWLSGLAAVVFCCAQALRFWTLKTLGAYWNVSVMTTSQHRPAFVSSGPYRFIRHPNYLVVIVEIATLPIAGGAVVSAVVFSILNAVILCRRIQVEEQALSSVSGYAEKMGRKPRFFPRLFAVRTSS